MLKGYQQKVSAFQDDETTSAEIKERSKISFCRKCGSKLISDSAFCDKCGTEILIQADNATPIKKCELCDKQTDHLTYCEIKDDLGTRYRNICDECVLKYGAKEKENVLQ